MVVVVMKVWVLVRMCQLLMRHALVLVMGLVVLVVMMVVMMTSVAIKPLHLRRHLMGSYESFYSIFWREAQSLWVDLLVTVGHPVEIVQVRLLLGRAEARGGGH